MNHNQFNTAPQSSETTDWVPIDDRYKGKNVSESQLPGPNYGDIEKGSRKDYLSTTEKVSIAGGELEEMMLDLEDRKAGGEKIDSGAMKEVKIALEALNGDFGKDDEARSLSPYGRLAAEIDRLQAMSSGMDNPAQKFQKAQIESKIRGYTLAADKIMDVQDRFTERALTEVEELENSQPTSVRDHQYDVVKVGILRDTFSDHNARVKRNAERRAERPSPVTDAKSGQSRVEVNEMLKIQYDLVAKQEADYTAQIDPDDLESGSFTKAQQEIWAKRKEFQDNPDELEKWNNLNVGLGAYKKAHQEGRAGELPADLHDLMSRRSVKEFLASVYPKSSAEQVNNNHTKPDTQPRTAPDKREHAVSPEEAVFGEVLAAARGNVTIEADVPGNADLRVGDQLKKFNGSSRGFNVFGSAAPEDGYSGLGLDQAPTVESVQFQSVAKEAVYEDVVVKKRFGKSETVRRFQGQKEVPLPDVINPTTGQRESGVAFRYSFSPSIMKDMPEGTPDFIVNDGRTGNMLNIATVLPKSVADKLEATIRENPQSVRDIVRQLVMTEGNVPEDVWNGTRPREDDSSRTNAAMRPPYDKLPQGWHISLYGNEAYKGSPYESLPVS